MNIENRVADYIISNKDKVKISSKYITKGDIFLALIGKNYHGNKFIKSAIQNGAKFCVTDNNNYVPNEKIIFVKNIFDYLTKIAVRKRNLYKGKVIGITGSAGKTTFKETLAFFLNKNHTISYSQKSYNNELGVIVSILNASLKSSFLIFELGTNNFGEIKYLTNLVKPSQIFITNIQSTHLENFKSKKNIAKEKSDIFNFKYNNQRKKVYLNITNKSEEIILKNAKKEKKLNIIDINKNNSTYFIKSISDNNIPNSVFFSINGKIIKIEINEIIMFRLINILFCYAFFSENLLNIDTITKNLKYLKPVEGRGLHHNIYLNNKKIKIIDESYNANPDTMYQSIKYFDNYKNSKNKKLLLLGNMNELGKDAYKMHLNLLNQIDKYSFKSVILCGEFFRRCIKKLNNPKNEFVYLENKNKIMTYLNKILHNNDTILIKCSNSTEINSFAKYLLKKGN